ncbi:MAG: HAMP domain-containing histidine kinase [Myxococcales bacterium]|nr:HAMP domain-containing histidine kinase [Myxococcales bacterium]
MQHSAAPLERPKIGARFLSIAAHDLRGAMANVRSFAGLLLSRGLVEGERGRKGAEAIVRNADRALALARDVFDSLRHELGEMPVNLEPTAFGPLLEAVVQKALQSALEPAPKLETDLPLGLPQVSLDAERTAHAFRELIDLSMANAGAAGKVEVLARVVPGHLLAAVADDGPPRSPEELAYALDRDSAAAHENRLGQAFRLCFAREELEAQGGRVSLASDEAGNEVQVLFPLALAG